jgi:hypothetical protein
VHVVGQDSLSVGRDFSPASLGDEGGGESNWARRWHTATAITRLILKAHWTAEVSLEVADSPVRVALLFPLTLASGTRRGAKVPVFASAACRSVLGELRTLQVRARTYNLQHRVRLYLVYRAHTHCAC